MKSLICFLLLLASGLARADSVNSDFPVFWVAGDPAGVGNAFKAVAAFFGSGDPSHSFMMSAMTAASMVGLLVAIVSSVIRSQFLVGQWFVGTVLAMAMFTPTTTITVKSFFDDTSAVISPRMIVVEHIPIGIAYPAGMASYASKAMSDRFMTWFAVDNEGAQVNGANGLMNPLKLLLRLENMYDCSHNHGLLCDNYLKWMKCPGVSARISEAWANDVGLYQLLNDYTIRGYTEYRRYSASYDPTLPNQADRIETVFMPCKQAGPLIYQAMTGYVDSDRFSFDVARGLPVALPDAASTGSRAGDMTAAGDQARSVLAQMQSSLARLEMENNDIAAALIFHKVVNAGNAALNGHSPRHAAELFVATMEKSRLKAVTDQAIQGSMFVSFMTSAMNMFSFLFAATAPLIILMAMVMGLAGFKIYGSWLLFGVWSQSWLPIAVLVSYYTEHNFWSRLADLSYSGQISQANIDNFFTNVSSVIYTGSTMMSAVPIITLSLLSGSIFAFSSLASKATGTDRDYGDSKRLPGDPYKAANADAYEKTATASGAVFSSGGGHIGGRLRDMDIEGSAKWTAGNAVSISHTNLKAAEQNEQITNQQLRTAQASLEAATRSAIQRRVGTGDTGTTKDSTNAGSDTSRNFGKESTHSEAINSQASLSGNVSVAIPGVSAGGAVGSSRQIQHATGNKNASQTTTKTGTAQGTETTTTNTSAIDVSTDKSVSAAQSRVAAAQTAHQRAVAARQTAQDEVKRAQDYNTGLEANIGKLTRDSYAADQSGAVTSAQGTAWRVAGDRGADKLNAAIDRRGGWGDQHAVTMGISSALHSSDQELKLAGLAAASELARHAGQTSVADAMRNEVGVRQRQIELENDQKNNALSTLANGGDIRAGAADLGVRGGNPAMPSTPSMPGAGAFGPRDVKTDQELASYYTNPDIRNDPNHATEVRQYDALIAAGNSGSTPEGQAILKAARDKDQQTYQEKREHLVQEGRVTKR